MSGEQIARSLGLRKAGAARWVGPCPCCGYRSGFAVTEHSDGLPLIYCNAGSCGQADLVAALRRRGLWGNHKEARSGDDRDEPTRQHGAKARERQRKIALIDQVADQEQLLALLEEIQHSGIYLLRRRILAMGSP